MKATDGHLRSDQSYELLNTEYNGKYSEADLTAVCWQCENCDKPIANIATVKGTVDGKEYRIGLDCASTLVGITPDAVKEAKKRMAREAKFRKWIMESMVWWYSPDGKEARLFEKEPFIGKSGDFEIPNWVYRCSLNKYQAALKNGKRELRLSRKVESEYVEGYFREFYQFQ